jgi:hypothetical protein
VFHRDPNGEQDERVATELAIGGYGGRLCRVGWRVLLEVRGLRQLLGDLGSGRHDCGVVTGAAPSYFFKKKADAAQKQAETANRREVALALAAPQDAMEEAKAANPNPFC